MRITNVKIPGTKYSPDPGGTELMKRGQYYGRILLIAGSAAAELGAEIAEHLDLRLSKYDRTIFPNENIFIRLNESMRGQDVYVIQSMATPLHESIFELMILIDTIKRDSAARVTVVVPYLAYGRSDKKDQPRVGIAARMIADMLQTAGADRYMTVDLHSGQIQGFFSIPGDALTAFHLLSDYVQDKAIDNLVVVSTDLGFAKKARNWAEKLSAPLTIIEKRRTGNDSTSEALSVIGEVRDQNVLLVDDEVLTGGSIVNAFNLLKGEGARDVYLAFTHAVLAKDAAEKLSELDVKEIITTNTLPISAEKRAYLPNMIVLSVAPLLGEVILRANQGRSVGELFHE
ncbi:MAG: ribose-phosphate pyrophosphokinase [Chloroflexota bacterium]|nr:ribose-phosphate pyrophosphokinase [Chloroflexota bacterium]